MRTNKLIAFLALGVLSAAACFATPVTGRADITGNVTLRATLISFSLVSSGDVVLDNVFAATGTATGDFTGLVGGTIQNLSGAMGHEPHIAQFATFQTPSSTILFDLTTITEVGAFSCDSGAVGTTCYLESAPILLFQAAADVVVAAMDLEGDAYLGPKTGPVSYSTGRFASQFVLPGHSTISDVLNYLDAGGSITSQYAGTFTATSSTATPEPSSLLLFVVGMATAALLARKKSAQV